MQSKGNQVMFCYIRDEQVPQRVLTLARRKEGDVLTFSFALNRVTEENGSWKVKDVHGNPVEVLTKLVRVHDKFTKKSGRDLALKRLNEGGSYTFKLQLDPEDRPLTEMLYFLSVTTFPGLNRSISSKVRSLATQALLNATEGF
jgi:hypothetical protein